MNLKTGTTIKASDHPKWVALDPYGSVLDFFDSRSKAREFLGEGRAEGYKGERLAKITAITVDVAK